MEQSDFLFETGTIQLPDISTMPPLAKPIPLPQTPSTGADLIGQIRRILPDLPDDLALEDPLVAIGLQRHSVTGWHRARSMDALIGLPFPTFQAYRTAAGALRYRRLPPLLPCPGYADQPCTKITRGGVRCAVHLDMEDEDLWLQP